MTMMKNTLFPAYLVCQHWLLIRNSLHVICMYTSIIIIFIHICIFFKYFHSFASLHAVLYICILTLQIITYANAYVISAGLAGHICYELSAETFNPDARRHRRRRRRFRLKAKWFRSTIHIYTLHRLSFAPSTAPDEQ